MLVMISGFALLAACAGPRPKFNSGVADPKVAADAQYKSANLRPYKVRGETYKPYIPDKGDSLTGVASWYGAESGNMTANGERFDPNAISAAHKTWPLPSVVEVTNLDNGRTIRLRLNDRGPFVDNRLIDLSKGAAKALGVYETGTARVKLKFIGPAETAAKTIYAEAPTRSDDEDRQYRVQVGAFSEKDNAERVKEALSARMDRSRGLYVVYLGPFKGAQRAELRRQEVLAAGYFDAILTRVD
ncbi:septal ring lytic transglycosylase RlpA family protein [Asticcacaulis sp. BYS171W]|uniref:Endolytic peptidoglycan transglycosylase RlpA n=1 Tax=Asticcacaulis aquaticus TaxID=2984212 RepID=A0ABT5HP09_9CAUL|nr:SPOR domain-containing protein [Asticcacaulis aquaticus]MDC7681793.1 septal ring lytic transglycosylase RlpA family protein [Asticcacaulis aquaticus]